MVNWYFTYQVYLKNKQLVYSKQYHKNLSEHFSKSFTQHHLFE